MTFRFNRRSMLSASAAAGLVGVTGMPVKAAAKKGGHMRMGKGHGSTSDSLDPATYENGFTASLSFGRNNYLTEIAPDGAVKAELAESWEASKDAKTWTFKVRRGVTFHNGKSVDAADVVASINHHRGEDSKSAAKPIVEPIEDIKALDAGTVQVTLKAGNADFPFIVSDYHLPIMPSKDDKITEFDVGCGAYVLKKFEPGVRAELEKNPNYWKSDRGHFDSVELLTIIDPTARTNALLSNQVEAIDKVDTKTTELFKRAPTVDLVTVSGNQHYTFAMNTTVAPYDNNHVRLALKLGVKRQELVDKVLNGYGSIGNDHPIGAGQRFFNKDLAQREYDPDKAKWHLKQAGLDSVDVALSSADAAFAGAVDAALLFSNSAKAGGINLKVVREPNDGYWSNVWMKKPFSAVYWNGRPIEDQMFSTAYAEGAAWNDSFWSNAKFNELLVAARAELDEAKRRQMYYEMQDIVSNDGGVIIPMFASYVFALSKKLGHEDSMSTNNDCDGERWMERWWMA